MKNIAWVALAFLLFSFVSAQDPTVYQNCNIYGICEDEVVSEASDLNLTGTYYTAQTFNVTAGTLDNGTLENITQYNDNYATIGESATTPGFEIKVNFTNVTSFDQVIIVFDYLGSDGHVVNMELWDYERGESISIRRLWVQKEFGLNIFAVDNSSRYIRNGVVQAEIDHDSMGNNAHEFLLDWLTLRQSPSGGGGGGSANSPLTTKGDIWGYSTEDARIPVGTDGYCLIANSSQALGVSWANVSGGSGSASAAGSEGEVQFYEGGNLGADTEFSWNTTTKYFSLGQANISKAPLNLIYRGPLSIPDSTMIPSSGAIAFTENNSVNYATVVTSTAAPGHRGGFNFRRARGTLASPAALQVAPTGSSNPDDAIGSLVFGAYDGSAARNSALIIAYADDNASSNYAPVRIAFETGTTSSTRGERIAVKALGNVIVGEADSGISFSVLGGNDSVVAYFEGNISADGYNEFSTVFEGDAISATNFGDYYLDNEGNINHSLHECYSGETEIIDTSRPVNKSYCDVEDDGSLVCYNRTSYPYKINQSMWSVSCKAAMNEQFNAQYKEAILPIENNGKDGVQTEFILAEEYITNTTKDVFTVQKIMNFRSHLSTMTNNEVIDMILDENGKLSDSILFDTERSELGSYNIGAISHFNRALLVYLLKKEVEHEKRIDALENELCILGRTSFC